MSRLWLVAVQTYRRQVLQKGFIASVLSVPLMIALMFGLIYLVTGLREDRRPVGYVDKAAVLIRSLPSDWDKGEGPALLPFASVDGAHQALMSGQIQAYYVVAADYRQSGQVEFIYKGRSGGAGAAQFHDLLRYNLLAQEPAAVAQRISGGMSVVIRRPDSSREFPDSASLADVAPLFVIIFMAMAFMFLVVLNPGQPMLAVVEEKENRTMELMVTSVSPNSLIGGKVLGSVAIAGTLVLGWVALIGMVGLVALRLLPVSWLQDVHLAPSTILFPASLYVPLYVIITALLTAVGATVVEAREAQQMSTIFIMPLLLPFYVLEPVMENPNGTLAMLFSFFPLSAPAVLPIRVYLQPVPAWQIGLSVALMLLSAAGAIWLAGRAFRLGMLRYGQRLSWREVLGLAGGKP